MKYFLLSLLIIPFALHAQTCPPAPYGAIPSARQLAWHELRMYAFICISDNTFTDLEWGYGDADPNVFCPEKLDACSWVKILKETGFSGMVLTTKHHDGFCLWPSEFTDYSVKSCKWRNGTGDVVRNCADAARKYGLNFGVYLSPWDRHDLRYGTPDYVTFYNNQLRELLTNYGPIFEVWEDGANGGDGYYGGKREKRKAYYDWTAINSIIRELQPQASIFGPLGFNDIRWCGNEKGYINEPVWNNIWKNTWVPYEVDVSIRPGWFFHEKENSKVKSGKELLEIYYTSIGRGANLILNIPPNRDGLFNKEDIKSLKEFGTLLKKEFSKCLNDEIKKVEATNIRGNYMAYQASNASDNNHKSYWATDDGVKEASLTFTFKKATLVNRAEIREYLPLGQRISSFSIEVQTDNNNWKEVARATTIGNRRLVRFDNIKTQAIRLNILGSKACPIISDVKFYEAR